MATNRGKIHGGKSVLNVHVASGEFGEITRFYCTCLVWSMGTNRDCVACLIPTTSGSCSCHEHTTNLAKGVSRQPALDCGTIFHPDCGSRDFPSILSDDL